MAYLTWLRPRLLRCGATDEEVAAEQPGDGLLPVADARSTMAVTLHAAPAQVWPWLAQMGCDRAGWYSWDWLDNARRPSSERIVPEWQEVGEGARLMSTPSGSSWFTAAIVEPPHTLVLRADLRLPGGTPFEPDEAPPRWHIRSTWGFHLVERPDGWTRLVVRTRSTGRPARLLRLSNLVMWEPAHLIMQRRQFDSLRRRTEQPGRGSR